MYMHYFAGIFFNQFLYLFSYCYVYLVVFIIAIRNKGLFLKKLTLAVALLVNSFLEVAISFQKVLVQRLFWNPEDFYSFYCVFAWLVWRPQMNFNHFIAALHQSL